MLHDKIASLVGTIYEAPHDPDLWRSMAISVLKTLDCRSVLISSVDARQCNYASTGFFGPEDSGFERAITEFTSDYHRLDPSLHFAAKNPSRRFCDARRLAATTDPAGAEFFKWYEDRFKAPFWVVGYTPPDDGLTFGVSLQPHASVGISRSNERLFQLLFHHLSRSVALAARPPSLENQHEAILYVRSSGRIAALSPAAETCISSQDGLRIEQGCLKAFASAETRSLERAIQAASNPTESGCAGQIVSVSRPAKGGSWLLMVSPLARATMPLGTFQSPVLIKIVEPNRPRRLTHTINEFFHLTAREQDVAELLMAGHSIESLAYLLSISLNTAKVHLHSLFKKTATTRQSDLVRLLLALS